MGTVPIVINQQGFLIKTIKIYLDVWKDVASFLNDNVPHANVGVFASIESIQEKVFLFLSETENLNIEGVFYLNKDINIKRKLRCVLSNSLFNQDSGLTYPSLKELYLYEFGKKEGSLKLAKLLCVNNVSAFIVVKDVRG